MSIIFSLIIFECDLEAFEYFPIKWIDNVFYFKIIGIFLPENFSIYVFLITEPQKV